MRQSCQIRTAHIGTAGRRNSAGRPSAPAGARPCARLRLPAAAAAAALAFCVTAAPASAEAPAPVPSGAGPLASYYENSGPLPPPSDWSFTVEIALDGAVRAETCRGSYPRDEPCREQHAQLGEEAVAAILEAARASELATRPAAEATPAEIPIGGGSSYGRVWLDGVEIELAAYPAREDAARVNAVLKAISGALPPGLKLAEDAW